MAGEAKTQTFNIGAATVMIGPMGSMFDLTQEEHSVGLAKNFTCSCTKEYITLTQGLTQEVVDSQVVGNTISSTVEVYEYTTKNLMYALGLDGSKTVMSPMMSLTKEIVGDGTATKTVEFSSDTDISSSFPAGADLVIQNDKSGKGDNVCIRTIDSVVYAAGSDGEAGTITVTLTEAVPTGMTFEVGDSTFCANFIPVGTDDPQPFLSMKVVQVSAANKRPITLIFPKIRISNGFNIGSQTDAYSQMTFEFTPYALLESDKGYDPKRTGRIWMFN